MNVLYNALVGEYNSAQTAGVQQKVIFQAKALTRLGANCDLKLITTSNVSGGVISENGLEFELQPLKNKNLFLRRKEIFNLFYKNTISQNYDFIYLRYPLAGPYFVSYLRKIQHNNRVITEHQSIEPQELLSIISTNRFLKYVSELAYRRKVKKYTYGLVSVTDEIDKYQLGILGKEMKSLVIGNGIDVANVPIRNTWNGERNIRLLFLGNISPWHGLDKLIIALSQRDFVYKHIPISIEIIGKGNCYSKLRELVRSLGRENNVTFHGFLQKGHKYKVMSACDIAIGSLASERRGIRESSNIKLREYCAFGVPFVKSDLDADFDSNKRTESFALTVRDDIQNDWVDQILEFAVRVKGDRAISSGMRNYAESALDWSVKLGKLVRYLESLDD